MIAPLKEEIKSELKSVVTERKRLFSRPVAVGIELNPTPCLLIRVEMSMHLKKRLQKMSKRERVDFLDGAGRKILSKDSLVAFVSGENVVILGNIVRREVKEEMLTYENCLCVGVAFPEVSLNQALSSLASPSNNSNHVPFPISECMLQSTTSFFAYEPVLSCLQKMTGIRFREELVLGSAPQPLVNPIT